MKYILVFFIGFLNILNSNTSKAEICLNYDECLPLAQQGDAYAQTAIGDIYSGYDETIQENHKKAFEWYYLAAQQGYADAQFAIAVQYDDGNGVSKDVFKAFTWYYLAAQQGDAGAQVAIGDYYYYGEEIPKDIKKAYGWYNLAANLGDKEAQKIMARLAKELSKEKLLEAQDFSIKLLNLYGQYKKSPH